MYHLTFQKAPKWIGKIQHSGVFYSKYKNGDKSYLLDNEYGIIFEQKEV